MKTKQYIETVAELKRLAETLPEKPAAEDVEHFLDLEMLADKYEKEQDLDMGLSEITFDIDDDILWFRTARQARRLGIATNDYVTALIKKDLRMDGDMDNPRQSLKVVRFGCSALLLIPREIGNRLGWMAGDSLNIDCRGEGLIIWKSKIIENG